MRRASSPIPVCNREAEVGRVGVEECGEGLSLVREERRIKVAAAYSRMGFASASESVWLRSGALSALQAAADDLPDGLTLLVWDGLRTLGTQREIADRLMRSASARIP